MRVERFALAQRPVSCQRTMHDGTPSRTAYRVALRRAAHQVFDQPVVFSDPLALRIIGLANADRRTLELSELRAPARPSSVSLRAFLVARSRFAEDAVHAAYGLGVRQYVLLGAGLDTFAYRNPHPDLRVFEVDHPATQEWKLDLLQRNSIAVPASVTHVAVDFQRDSLSDRLAATGFRTDQPAIFGWLGVVPYLSHAGFSATLDFLSACAPGSSLVLDYGLPRDALPFLEQLAFDSLAARVAAAGEPFQLFFNPEELHGDLRRRGWQVQEDLAREDINDRYFAEGKLRCLGSGPHLLRALLESRG
jgi:methyltransferase (TIGR00027 family)